MSVTQCRPEIETVVCETCCQTPGGCDCQTNLSTASPEPTISGLNTSHGSFDASFYGLYTDPSTGAAVEPVCHMGTNWLPQDWAYFTTLQNGDLAFIWGPQRAYWFTPTGGGAPFIPQFGVKAELSKTSSTYTLTEEDGTSYDFDATTGMLVTTETPGGQKATNSFDASGKVTKTLREYPTDSPTTKETRLYSYYGTEGGGNEGQLKYATLQRSKSPDSPFRRLSFTYYDSNESGGNLNDLKSVTHQVAKGAAWQDVETRMFRYYKPAFPI